MPQAVAIWAVVVKNLAQWPLRQSQWRGLEVPMMTSPQHHLTMAWPLPLPPAFSPGLWHGNILGMSETQANHICQALDTK